MTFIHERPEFGAVLRAAAASSVLQNEALVEKDYWVTHALWSLSRTEIVFFFKGGTSLSKAFRVTNRFSEDLDLVVLPGSLEGLPTVTSWRSDSKTATASRRNYWEAVTPRLTIPGCTVALQASAEETYCNPSFRAQYPGVHLQALSGPGSVVTPYVLLELAHGAGAHCAVAPFVRCPITSFLHEFLDAQDAFAGADAVIDNRPAAIDCVHPVVTLIEKLDAITRRYARSDEAFAPGSFARHYEDAARIIQALQRGELPPIPQSVAEVAAQLLADRHIRKLVRADDPALRLPDNARYAAVERAYEALSLMFWQPQMPLEQAQSMIIVWLEHHPMAR